MSGWLAVTVRWTRVQEAVPDGRLPDGALGAQHLRDVFYRMVPDRRPPAFHSGTLGRTSVIARSSHSLVRTLSDSATRTALDSAVMRVRRRVDMTREQRNGA
jgi:hypothetical protein